MINQSQLKNAIKAAFDDESDTEVDEAEARDRIADKISAAVVVAIKQMTITYSSGLAAPSGGGPVTGSFNYTIT